MGWTDWRLRLRALLRHGRAERELQEEMNFHHAMAARQGAARAAFGSADLALEECRDARGLRLVEELGRDLKLAVRRMRLAPGFPAAAILTLALGIGANAALFTLVDAVMLQRLPVPHPEQLVLMGDPGMDGMGSGTEDTEVNALTYPQYESLREQSRSFSGLAAFAGTEFTMRVEWGGAAQDAVPIKLVSDNYFQVLALRPARGRFFDAAEATPRAAPEAVLSYGYWQQQLGGHEALGQTFRLRGQPYTVIGVAPRGFDGTTVGQAPAIYLPLRMIARVLPGRDMLHDPPGITRLYWLLGLGRLKSGVTLSQAKAESAVIFAESVRAQAALAPDSKTRAGLLTQWLPLVPAGRGASSVENGFGRPLLILQALSGVVLLIVVVNLGGMLLAQAAARRREFAMRMALGAGRGRLVRQLLTESLLLAVMGGGAGWLLAQWAARLLVSLVAAAGNDIALPLAVSRAALAFTAGITLLAAIGFGLKPALDLSRRDLAQRQARFRAAGGGAFWVVAQVALAIVLVAGAALFARSLQQLHKTPLGFQPSGLVEFNFNAAMAGASNSEALEIYRRVADETSHLPGVIAATYSDDGLFTGRDADDDVSVEGYSGNAHSDLDSVAPGFFAALGIRIRLGREFAPADGTRGVMPAVIDEAFAQRYFAGRDPLGQMVTVHFTFGDARYEIVGVSAKALINDAREDPGRPRMFFDIDNRGAVYPVQDVNFSLRMAPGAALTRPRINVLVARVWGRAPQVNSFTTVDELLAATQAPDLLLVKLSGFFAVLALGLAALGLYALLSYAGARRRAEIGIRMALGARSGQVMAMVLRQALILLALGIGLGVAASLAAGRALGSLLFQLKTSDPVSMAAAVLLLLAAGLAAALAPALRASRTDPAQTLRAE